jgi:RNA recognition motif-containing protein
MQRKRSFEESGIDIGERQSLWLKHFLSQKKTSAIPHPPIIEETRDTYLRQFAEQFSNSDQIIQEVDNDDLNSLQSSITNPALRRDDSENSEDEILLQTAENARIRLSNLPYIMDKAAIIKAGMKYGVQFIAVTIELDERTNLPSGSASVELGQSVDEVTAIQKLLGEDFGGRPVRVQSQQPRKRRASGGRADNRYFAFSDAAEVKCKMCGNLRHTARYCSELKSVLPCHLCAGKDHEAGKTT